MKLPIHNVTEFKHVPSFSITTLSFQQVQVAMITRGLETDQWMNREEWRLVSGRQRQMS